MLPQSLVEQGDVVVAGRENVAMVLPEVAIVETEGVENGRWLLRKGCRGDEWKVRR